MVIILTLYLSLVWLLFFKFKVLPWNTISQWIVILAGTVILSGFLVGLQGLTPSSTEAGILSRIVDIAPQVNGRVTKVNVQALKHFEEGDVLFEIDPTLYEARVRDLEAQLALAKLRMAQSRELVEADAGSRFEFESYEAQVDQLVARLASARFDLENTKVRAPMDGYSPLVPLDAGVQVSPQRAVLTFLAEDEFVIAGRFAQKALQNVKPGDKALVNFPALPGQVFETQVKLIPGAIGEGQLIISGTLPSLQQSRMVRQWPVMISVPEDFPEELKKPGVAATVYIHTEGAGVVGIVAVVLQWVGTSLDAIL